MMPNMRIGRKVFKKEFPRSSDFSPHHSLHRQKSHQRAGQNRNQSDAGKTIQWPRNFLRISPPFCQKIRATPINAPPAMMPEATG